MANQHRLKLDLIRNGTLMSSIEPSTEDSDPLDYNVNTTNSIDTFPIATLASTRHEINSSFLSFAEGDLIRISVARDSNEDFMELFLGEFHKKDISYDKEKGEYFNLEIMAIHSFSRLCYLRINTILEFDRISFKDLIHLIASKARIPSKILISDRLANLTVEGLSQNTNAFRLFKELCLQKDAIVRFNTNNTVSILDRAEFIHSVNKQIPQVINLEKDVKSWKVTK